MVGEPSEGTYSLLKHFRLNAFKLHMSPTPRPTRPPLSMPPWSRPKLLTLKWLYFIPSQLKNGAATPFTATHVVRRMVLVKDPLYMSTRYNRIESRCRYSEWVHCLDAHSAQWTRLKVVDVGVDGRRRVVHTPIAIRHVVELDARIRVLSHCERVHVVKVVHLVRGARAVGTRCILVAVEKHGSLVSTGIDDEGGHRVPRHQTAALPRDGFVREGRGTHFVYPPTREVAVVGRVTGRGYSVECDRSLVAEIDEPRGLLLPCRGLHVLVT